MKLLAKRKRYFFAKKVQHVLQQSRLWIGKTSYLWTHCATKTAFLLLYVYRQMYCYPNKYNGFLLLTQSTVLPWWFLRTWQERCVHWLKRLWQLEENHFLNFLTTHFVAGINCRLSQPTPNKNNRHQVLANWVSMSSFVIRSSQCCDWASSEWGCWNQNKQLFAHKW